MRFNLNTEVFYHLSARLGHIGLKPRVLAMILIAATTAYASYDLFQRISTVSVVKPRLSGQAEKRAAKIEQQAAPAGKNPLEAYQIIAERNLFGSTDKVSAGIGKGSDPDRLEKTALQLDLIGTIAGEDIFSRAVISDPEQKKPRIFKVGDEIGNAKIVKIMRRSVVLNVDGKEEVLMMKAQRPATGAPANRPSDRSSSALPRFSQGDRMPAAAGSAGVNIRDLTALAQVHPHFEGGKMDGYYLGNVEEGGLLKRVGLQSGDIVEGINDHNFTKPDDINQLQNMNLSPGTKTTLKVRRQGRSITLNLD